MYLINRDGNFEVIDRRIRAQFKCNGLCGHGGYLAPGHGNCFMMEMTRCLDEAA